MNRTFLMMTLTAAVLALLTTQSNAQSGNCAPHDIVVERLADSYGESRQSIGIGANNTVVEVFAALDTGSWTITVTAPGGPTCMVASGQAFQVLADGLPNTDSPA
ncbi:MAG: hypothetical protein ACI86S_000064 [Paracoccaceae bacterium]|jgi:hypothetical protein